MMLYNFTEVMYNTLIKFPMRKERTIMKRIIALSLVVVSVLMCLAACGGNTSNSSDLAYVQGKNKLVVGITDYAPMDFKDENGNWTGFDAEFAQMFAEELGVEVEFFVLADWGKKFFELDSKNIDVICNGMTINEDVTLNTNCSDPYVINAQVVVMKADLVGNYTTPESLKDLSIAVESGSAGEDAAKAIGCTNIVAVQDQGAAVMEAAAGTSDACVIDITMARAMTGEGTSYENLAIGVSLTEEFYGVGFRKGSDITAKFHEFLANSMEDGTLDALAAKYNLTLAK